MTLPLAHLLTEVGSTLVSPAIKKVQMGHEIIKYKGKSILFADYSTCKNKEEIFALLESSVEVLSNSPEKLRVLINVERVSGTREFQKRAKELGEKTEDKVLKRAVLGITGLKKVLLMGFNNFTKKKAHPFDTKEEALEFLVAD